MLLHLHCHRQHNTRHLSFTNGGGGGGGDGASSSSNSPAGVAASMQAHHQQQQRSSSSSLQVLASLQLDATLASITQEARHDGALAERLAHGKRAFREKGELPAIVCFCLPYVVRGLPAIAACFCLPHVVRGLPALAASFCLPHACRAVDAIWWLGNHTLDLRRTRACKVTHVTHGRGFSLTTPALHMA
jgi:hypothetical protein